ncbi:MAG: threonine/serine dehydratase [Gaiellales bacterium]
MHRTPVMSSRTLTELSSAPVVLKAELFQRTGSFKLRGVTNRLAALGAEDRTRGVIAVSAGNHAQALAHGCATEGIDCLVMMWRGASEAKAAAAAGYGATVDLESDGPSEAFARMEEIRRETGRVVVHPFSDPLVIAGQGTVGLEILADVPDVELVLVPTGGGGLVSGIAAAIKPSSPQVRVVAVEPEQAPALAEGLSRGTPVSVDPVSIADGLAAPYTATTCIEVCHALGVETVQISEDEIREGLRFVYARAKLACEPAGAAGVAALLAGKVDPRGSKTVAVVSGGNVDAAIASATLAGE